MDGTCSTHGGMKNTCTILVGKSEGKRPLGRESSSHTQTIHLCVLHTGWGGDDGVDYI
jgi:hypothetical protein